MIYKATRSFGQVEKQDTSGNEREHECESETVDHVMVVESDFKGWTNG